MLIVSRNKNIVSVSSATGNEPDPDKFKAFAEWLVPGTLIEFEAIVAMANYRRRHVKKFAEIGRPLQDLTKRTAIHLAERTSARQRLKASSQSYLILATPMLGEE